MNVVAILLQLNLMKGEDMNKDNISENVFKTEIFKDEDVA